jgi:hypothetical protein
LPLSFQELEFISNAYSIPRSSSSVGKSISSATLASQLNIDFQHSLDKYFRDATQLTTDYVCTVAVCYLKTGTGLSANLLKELFEYLSRCIGKKKGASTE